MRTSRVCAAVALSILVCGAATAEIVVANPLIKPPQITPLAAGTPGGPAGAAQAGDPGMPGSAPLPRLPGLAMPRAASGQGGSYGDAAESGGRKGDGGDALRNALGRYQVVFVSADHAVLRSFTRSGQEASQGGQAQQGQGLPMASAAASAIAKGGPPQMTVRHKGRVKFGGELLRVRIDGDTVELFREGGGKRGVEEDETVFFESLTPSSTPAYVPDPSRLEKPDTRYHNSIAPEPSKTGLGSSPTPGSNNGPSSLQ